MLCCFMIIRSSISRPKVRRPRVEVKCMWHLIREKLSVFNCHTTGLFARSASFKGTKAGSRQEQVEVRFKPVRTEKESLDVPLDEGQINWVLEPDYQMRKSTMLTGYSCEIMTVAIFKQGEYKGVPILLVVITLGKQEGHRMILYIDWGKRTISENSVNVDSIPVLLVSRFPFPPKDSNHKEAYTPQTLTLVTILREDGKREAAYLRAKRGIPLKHMELRVFLIVDVLGHDLVNRAHLMIIRNLLKVGYVLLGKSLRVVSVVKGLGIGISLQVQKRSCIGCDRLKRRRITVSKSVDELWSFRKVLDAIALKHFRTSTLHLVYQYNNPVTMVVSILILLLRDAEIRIYDKSSEGIFEQASYDDDGVITDFNNLPDEVDVITNPTLRDSQCSSSKVKSLDDPNTPVSTSKLFKKTSLRWEAGMKLCTKNVAVHASTSIGFWLIIHTGAKVIVCVVHVFVWAYHDLGSISVVDYGGSNLDWKSQQESEEDLLGHEKNSARLSLANWKQFGCWSKSKSLERNFVKTKQTLGNSILQLIEKSQKARKQSWRKKRKSKERTKDAGGQDKTFLLITDQDQDLLLEKAFNKKIKGASRSRSSIEERAKFLMTQLLAQREVFAEQRSCYYQK
ncbi:hypothetical protein Tco_1409538 [Tanacetum coccineum]